MSSGSTVPSCAGAWAGVGLAFVGDATASIDTTVVATRTDRTFMMSPRSDLGRRLANPLAPYDLDGIRIALTCQAKEYICRAALARVGTSQKGSSGATARLSFDGASPASENA